MLTLAALVCALVAAQPEQGSDSLVFATGREGGNYSALARVLAERSDRWCPGCRIELRATGGSYDNARLLRSGEADLALIQSDVAYLEYFEGRPYLAVAAPYVEPIHIVVRRELGLTRLSELKSSTRSFQVAIGPSGSGSTSHALTLLHELEAEGATFDLLPGSVADGFTLLRDREADVAFVTSAVPVEAITKLANEDAIGLLEVDADLAHRLREKNPFFSLAEIPYQAYKGIQRDVATLGTRTLLVVRKDFPADRVEGILETLYQLGGPQPALSFLRDLSADRGFEDLSIPSHPQASLYHRSHESRLLRVVLGSRRYLLPVAVLIAPLLVLLGLPRASYFIHQFVLGRVFALLITIWLVGSAAMYLLEGAKNSNFRTLGSSAMAILHYLFSGFEAKFPITVPGNVVAILILSLGAGVVTLFTATVVTLLVERALSVRRIRAKPKWGRALRSHVVLVGWSERAERVLQHLRNRDVKPRPAVVVASAKTPRPLKLAGKTLRGVWSVTAERIRETLVQADLPTARVALVLGEESDRRADWRTTAAALAVDRVAPRVHTIVEVFGGSCCEHLQSLRADEIVVMDTLGKRLVSQCTITPGIGAVYDELLTFGVGSQEIYLSPIPRHLAGRTFRDIRRSLLGAELVPIGYRRPERGEVRINPRGDDPVLAVGKGGDELVFLADNARALRGSWSWPRRPAKPKRHQKGSPMPSSELKPPPTRSTRETTLGICGWGAEARHVLQQLRETVIASHQKFSVTVISEPERAGFGQPGNGDLHEDVRFVIGDPTRRLVLKNAGVGELRSLVILADRSSEEAATYSDHRALIIALAASALNPSLHIVVELLHSRNREHFAQIPAVEVVSVEELSEKLLAQAVVNPGITEVYLELLTATEDSNEVYIVPVPAPWVGRTYQEVYTGLLEAGEAVIPIGYWVPAPGGGGQVVLNPRGKPSQRKGDPSGRGYPLAADDGLVVIAYEEPDLAALAAGSALQPDGLG